MVNTHKKHSIVPTNTAGPVSQMSEASKGPDDTGMKSTDNEAIDERTG